MSGGRRVRRLAALIALVAVGLLAPALGPDTGAQGQRVGAPIPVDVEVALDAAVAYQTWDGWGVNISGLPWEWSVLHYLNRVPPEEQRGLQDSLFGPGGYTLATVYSPARTTPGSARREGYEPANDDHDPERLNWGGFRFPYTPGDPNPYAAPEEAGYTAATFRIIADLQRYGTEMVFNAADFPAWIVTPDGEIRREMESEFVEYVTAFPIFVRDQLGYTFPYLIIANEPDLSLKTTPEQQARLVRLAEDRLRRAGMPTRLLAPKTSRLEDGLRYAAALLRPGEPQPDLPILATHTYPTNRYDERGVEAFRRLASASGRRLWLTEFSDAPDLKIPRDDPRDTPERALAWAGRVHRDLTEMQVNAWFGMFPVIEAGHYSADALVVVQPNQSDPTRNSWQFTRRYYALGQYTRFIRPGAVRVEVRSSTPEVAVVAFRDPAAETVALVALNRGDADRQASIQADNLDAAAAVAYRTSATESLRCLGPVDLTDPSGLPLPGRSITTIVVGPSAAVPSCEG